jgi:hypothetical protein
MVRDPLLGPPDLVLLLPLGAAGERGGPGEILGDKFRDQERYLEL